MPLELAVFAVKFQFFPSLKNPVFWLFWERFPMTVAYSGNVAV